MKRKNGFTLIELVVVIALIAILAVTLAPRLRDQIAKARDAKAIGALGAVRTASEIYFADNGAVPQVGSDVDDLTNVVGNVDAKTLDLLTEGSNVVTAAKLPVGGGQEGTATADGVVVYAASGDTVDVNFGTDGIELNFTTSTVGTDGVYDTKGNKWASY